MKFLLWEIKVNNYRLANLQWVLFKLFNIRPVKQCGRTKNYKHLCCSQPIDAKHCYVINEEKLHEVRCKCCNATRIMSSTFIEDNEEVWMSIDF